ncbi:MAG: S-methyl-5'-thioadenosine phosphorylase [Firmicutes bacterium]|nr:S-methyl-5'-thioadenosine phosphorylase [Bacillota bacterium]
MPRIGLIGGTGVYNPKLLDQIKEVNEVTKYGEVRAIIGKYKDEEIVFIPRHGAEHTIPPHLINYRANIMALKQMGVQTIIATAAVGSLHFDRKPGQYVLADQFIDFTKVRKNSFFEGGEEGVIHCDMTVPYCPEVRAAIKKAGDEKGLKIYDGGTYVCTEGPRFETAAEIEMFKQLGGQVVGMTSVPEVCLAREMGICYANVCIITNHAAGMSPHILNHVEVVEVMRNSIHEVRYLILESIKYLSDTRSCDCREILKESRMG